MKKESVLKFMAALGIQKPWDGQVWVTGPCPLAPFTHKKGTDSRPSFGINVETGNYNCFTCTQGSLPALLQALEMYVGQAPGYETTFNFALARQILEGADSEYEPLPDYEAPTTKDEPFEPWPEWWLDQFIPWNQHPRPRWYLEKGRKEMGKGEPIDPAIADELELRYDAFHDRLVCPYRNFAGKLAGARGRAIDPGAKAAHYDYTYNKVNNAHCVWYNERALELACEDRKPVLVVEGQFDCANVKRVYPYVVAGLTAKSSLKKIQKLMSCDAVATMLDNDETGKKAHERYEQHLYGKVTLGRVFFPSEFKDPAFLTIEAMQKLFKPLLDW